MSSLGGGNCSSYNTCSDYISSLHQHNSSERKKKSKIYANISSGSDLITVTAGCKTITNHICSPLDSDVNCLYFKHFLTDIWVSLTLYSNRDCGSEAVGNLSIMAIKLSYIFIQYHYSLIAPHFTVRYNEIIYNIK